jgi:hypothetical protein
MVKAVWRNAEGVHMHPALSRLSLTAARIKDISPPSQTGGWAAVEGATTGREMRAATGEEVIYVRESQREMSEE